jgi:hypothetical protein
MALFLSAGLPPQRPGFKSRTQGGHAKSDFNSNFENDDSVLAVTVIFHKWTDSANFHFSPSFLLSSSALSPLALVTD